MVAISSSDLREGINAYLSGEVSLADLSDWMVGTTWNLSEVEDPEAYRIAGRFTLYWATWTSDGITLTQLRRYLLNLVGTDLRVTLPTSSTVPRATVTVMPGVPAAVLDRRPASGGSTDLRGFTVVPSRAPVEALTDHLRWPLGRIAG